MGIELFHHSLCSFRRALICDHTALDSDSADAVNHVLVFRSGFQSACLNRHTELKREMARSVSFHPEPGFGQFLRYQFLLLKKSIVKH